MPQPPPAAPQTGALGQEAAPDVEAPAAKVESSRVVLSAPHSGQGVGESPLERDWRRENTTPHSSQRYS